MLDTITFMQGDLTTCDLEAIVNAANSTLLGGGGVDGAIHRAGGPDILEACRLIRDNEYPHGLPTGEAVITTGGNLPATWVIHTVGPVWQGGGQGEADLLENAYRNVLKLAAKHDIRTIAFPSISTGVYGYPIEKASRIALRTVLDVVNVQTDAFSEIRFVLFSEPDYRCYLRTFARIR